jgi:hypothetical protein
MPPRLHPPSRPRYPVVSSHLIVDEAQRDAFLRRLPAAVVREGRIVDVRAGIAEALRGDGVKKVFAIGLDYSFLLCYINSGSLLKTAFVCRGLDTGRGEHGGLSRLAAAPCHPGRRRYPAGGGWRWEEEGVGAGCFPLKPPLGEDSSSCSRALGWNSWALYGAGLTAGAVAQRGGDADRQAAVRGPRRGCLPLRPAALVRPSYSRSLVHCSSPPLDVLSPF